MSGGIVNIKVKDRDTQGGESMTNEQAIEILKKLQIEFNENYIDYSGVNEAYNLAIKALEEVEEWHKLKLICANEGIMVYKIRGEKE